MTETVKFDVDFFDYHPGYDDECYDVDGQEYEFFTHTDVYSDGSFMNYILRRVSDNKTFMMSFDGTLKDYIDYDEDGFVVAYEVVKKTETIVTYDLAEVSYV